METSHEKYIIDTLHTVLDLLILAQDCAITWSGEDLRSAFQWAHTLQCISRQHFSFLEENLNALDLPHTLSRLSTQDILSNPHVLLLKRLILHPGSSSTTLQDAIASYISVCVLDGPHHLPTDQATAENLLCTCLVDLIDRANSLSSSLDSILHFIQHRVQAPTMSIRLGCGYFLQPKALKTVAVARCTLLALEEKRLTFDRLLSYEENGTRSSRCNLKQQVEVSCFILLLPTWEELLSRSRSRLLLDNNNKNMPIHANRQASASSFSNRTSGLTVEPFPLTPARASVLRELGMVLSACVREHPQILSELSIPLIMETCRVCYAFARVCVEKQLYGEDWTRHACRLYDATLAESLFLNM